MKTTLLVFVCGFLMLSSPLSKGDSFQVVSNVTGFALATASDADGDFVVVWKSDLGVGNGDDIYAKLFDASGNPRGDEFLVNTYTPGDQGTPAVAMDADGDFVITWEGAEPDGMGLGVFARRYSASGQPEGEEFQVTSTFQGDQPEPRVAMNVRGDFIVVWKNSRVLAQRYDAWGERVGIELHVNTNTVTTAQRPAVAMDSHGGFVVVWEQASPGTFTHPVMARRFDPSVTSPGGEVTVGHAFRAAFSRVAMDASGDFVVVWKDASETVARRFATDGVAKGDSFIVDIGGGHPQGDVVTPANVTSDCDGDFAVVWETYVLGSGFETYCQRYSSAGATNEPRFVLSPQGPIPDVAADAAGNLIVAWKVGSRIFGQRFSSLADTAGPIVTDMSRAGQRLEDVACLTESVPELVINFSEALESDVARTNSAVNPSNWTLERDGVEIPDGISNVSFSFNQVSHKYEATVSFDANGGDTGTLPLFEGEYRVTIRDSISDLNGNALDGNFDGVPGGDCLRSFTVIAPLNHWNWRNPLPNGNILNGVTYGGGLFVAVGEEGTILTSFDGTNWISRDSGTADALVGIAYGNGLFVAVGGVYGASTFYGSRLVTSLDGVSWSVQDAGTTNLLIDVAYGGGTFAASGINGAILTSTDGVIWTLRESGTTAILREITYGDGVFVAVGGGNNTNSGTTVVSTNGADWFYQSDKTWPALNGVTHGNGMFVAVGGVSPDPDEPILVSSNGMNWEVRHVGVPVLVSVEYGAGLFVAGDFYGDFYTSPDALTWTARESGFSVDFYLLPWYSVAYGNDRFIAVGSYNIGIVAASKDGLHWGLENSITPNNLRGVSVGSNTFVAVGSGGTVVTSTNGVQWVTTLTGTTANLLDVTYANGTFVAVGGSGTILTSGDGANWIVRNSGTNRSLYAVTFGETEFVAIGQSGTILVSTDSTNWAQRNSGTTRTLEHVAYGNGIYVAIAFGNSVSSTLFLASTNTIDWTSNLVSLPYPIRGIAFGNGLFVAVSAGDGVIFTSTNGLNWSTRSSGVENGLTSIAFAQGIFVATAWPNIFLSSIDGVEWTSHKLGFDVLIEDLVYGNNSFVGVGGGGTIIQSDTLTGSLPSLGGSTLMSQSVSVGGRMLLTASAYGTSPFRYQWYKDGILLGTATNAALEILNMQPSDAGHYAVVVSNCFGSITSSVATVTVTDFIDPALSITMSAGLLTISWPSAATGFSLECVTSISPPILWEPVTNAITEVGFLRVFHGTNDFSATNRFYRLRKL